MRGITPFLGIILIIFGAIIIFNNSGGMIFKIIDNEYYERTLFTNINDVSTLVNRSFEFDKDYINSIYKIDNGEKIYLNYINIYCTEFKDNSSIENITSITLNDNLYVPQNKTYQYSMVIIEDSLSSDSNNNILIQKSSDLVIDKITISYIGANYDNKETYDTISLVFSILVLFCGLGLLTLP